MIVRRLLPWGLALGIIAPFCFSVESETDLGWHLAIGRIISQSGIPHTNALCWTALNEPWYATSWLFDWMASVLAGHLGLIGVQWLMFVLVGLALTGAMESGLRIDGRFGAWVTPILALLLIPRMSARPFVASWAVLAWVQWLCLRPQEERGPDWDASFRRRLIALPLIAIGSNFHSGAIFPSILLFIFCCEAWLLGGRRWREVALALGGFMALLANPGGVFNVHYVIQHLSVRDVVPLAEFQRPVFSRAYLFFLLSAVVALLTARLWRTRPALIVSAVTFTGLGCWALRLMYDEEIIAVPLLALAFAPLLSRIGARGLAGVLGVVIGLLSLNRREWKDFVRIGAAWDEHRLPVRAAEFVREQHLEGRMFNAFEEGGYLEWALPELKWFQDGRVQAFPPAFFKAGLDVDSNPPAFRDWLREQGIEWGVATMLKRDLAGRGMFDSPQWALVYWDDASSVYLRRDVPRFAPLIERLEYHHFLPTAQRVMQIAIASRQQLDEWKAELDRFETTAPKYQAAWLSRCALAVRGGGSTADCDVAATLSASARWQDDIAHARAIPRLP